MLLDNGLSRLLSAIISTHKPSRTLLVLGTLLLPFRDSNGATSTPGPMPSSPIALVGGTIHTVSDNGTCLGTLVIDQGKVTAVNVSEIPSHAQKIDISGKHVYPGLFHAHTELGLIEISSIRATLDQTEVGKVNPNVKTQVAVNPDSELIPVTRANGVLLSLTVPDGPLIQGASAILQLDGWTWEEMTLRSPAAIHIRWPIQVRSKSSGPHAGPDANETALAKSYAEQVQLLETTFIEARAYHARRDAKNPEERIDLRWEAMRPLLRGEIPLIASADDLVAIQHAVAFAQRHHIKLIISGGYDAPHCAELLKANNIPVIVGSIYRLPARRDESYDEPYTLPERLRKEGIRFCIAGGGRFEASNARNLPYHAATAVAYGLPPEEGFKAITLYPAQILGIDSRVGSIQVGKDATIIVTDGDPLETSTHVEQAFVQGRPVDLSSRHTQLWNKYQQKYDRMKSKLPVR